MKAKCDPVEIAVKSCFLGPQSENAPWLLDRLSEIARGWFAWRRACFPQDGRAISEEDQALPEYQAMRARLDQGIHDLLDRFEKELPKFSPRYIGHMFSEISLPALLGHIVTLLYNPNNVSGEASRAGIKLEQEAIAELAGLLGYPRESAMGHFTSGGTIANIEALRRARALAAADPGLYPRLVVLAPASAHYSWPKAVELLGLRPENLQLVELDEHGRLSVRHLERRLREARAAGNLPALVVSVAGSTELGGVDPAGEVQDLLDEWRNRTETRIWHHVDAAYGGFFRVLASEIHDVLSPSTRQALQAISRADSVSIDPHKLGYVPYASGAFLVRDRRDYPLRTPAAPYIRFDAEHDRGLFTLEGSRSAAGAVATWLTARTIGFGPEGLGRVLERTVRGRLELHAELARTGLPIRAAPGCDTNILCFTVAAQGQPVSEANRLVERLHGDFSASAGGPFYVSMTRLERARFGRYLESFVQTWKGRIDADELLLLRLCVMNPFFTSSETATRFPSAFARMLAAHARMA